MLPSAISHKVATAHPITCSEPLPLLPAPTPRPTPLAHGCREGDFKYVKQCFWKIRINMISSLISEIMIFYERAE